MPIGLQLGATGTGGAILRVPVMVYIAGIPLQQAIGTSLSIIALISVGGVVGHLQFGRGDWSLLPFVLLGSLACMILGVRMGARLSPMAMSRVTASITISVALSLILINTAKLLGLLG